MQAQELLTMELYNSSTMNKILSFFLLVLAFMGIVGGIGYTVYYKAYPIALGIGVVGWMAWPKIKEIFEKLKN